MSSARKTYGGGKAFFRRGSSSQRTFAGSTLFSSVGELHTLQSELQLRKSCLGVDHPATIEVAQAIDQLLLAPVRTSTSPCTAESPSPSSPVPLSTDIAVNEVSCSSSNSTPRDASMDDLGVSDDACESTQDCSFASEGGESSRESDVGGDDGDSGDEAPILTKRAAPHPKVAPAAAAAFPGTNRSYRRQRRKQLKSDAMPRSMGYVSGMAVAGDGGSSICAAASSSSESQSAASKRLKPRPPSPNVSASALAELEAQRRYFETVDEQELSFEDSEERPDFSMNSTGISTASSSSGMRAASTTAGLSWPKVGVQQVGTADALSVNEPTSPRSRRELALQRASLLFDDEELGRMVECG